MEYSYAQCKVGGTPDDAYGCECQVREEVIAVTHVQIEGTGTKFLI